MIRVRTIDEVRAALSNAFPGSRIAFVPTMGALHRGHAACFEAAGRVAPCVAASVFVNPTQFNDPADYAAYTRDEDQDAAIAEAAGVHVLFVPSAGEMYPEGFATAVDPGGAAEGFEGQHRPGHFRGVATVCAKLFAIVRPHIVCFGQKDAQQLAVIRQIVRDLDLDLEVLAVPTVRDNDGLALSSRNARLTSDERARALAIPRALARGLEAYRTGGDAGAAARAALEGLRVDYAEVVRFDGAPTLVVAATVGRTRLIDNVPLDRPELAGFGAGRSHRELA